LAESAVNGWQAVAALKTPGATQASGAAPHPARDDRATACRTFCPRNPDGVTASWRWAALATSSFGVTARRGWATSIKRGTRGSNLAMLTFLNRGCPRQADANGLWCCGAS